MSSRDTIDGARIVGIPKESYPGERRVALVPPCSPARGVKRRLDGTKALLAT